MSIKPFQETLLIPVDSIELEGELICPPHAKGLVLFAHGSGSSRFSPRNQFVAKSLQESNLATLLIDLLTPQEEKIDLMTRELRFDIELLANRLLAISRWLINDKRTRSLSMGYFGSSTGAAAALIAAASMGKLVAAIVSRGGRPDLASKYLPQVQAPTLLIVGGADSGVIELNQEAYDLLPHLKKLEIIPGATHLFEESGALEMVAELAKKWFLQYL